LPQGASETEAQSIDPAAAEETAGGALERQEQEPVEGVEPHNLQLGAQSSLMNPDEEAGAPVDPRRPDMRRIYAERGGGRAGAMAGIAHREQEHAGSTEQLSRNEPGGNEPLAGSRWIWGRRWLNHAGAGRATASGLQPGK
jgi:hypothetical protein